MNILYIFLAKYFFILSPLILGIYFMYLPLSSKKKMAIFALTALIFTYILGVAAGYLYFDPRPFVVGHFAPLIPHAPDNGFPSDHALFVSGLAMVGLYWSRRLGIALWIIAILVSIGRVLVGVHHFVDVAGSMLIAIIGVSLMYYTIKNINTKYLHKTPDLNQY
ncbi:MAG TPA: phosphatase PAP2 family protein [Candidatus Paceibacterota bacterium]|nr:phosphatase PAP2 family protein [Candidatus Paceibacterota bacterium]